MRPQGAHAQVVALLESTMTDRITRSCLNAGTLFLAILAWAVLLLGAYWGGIILARPTLLPVPAGQQIVLWHRGRMAR